MAKVRMEGFRKFDKELFVNVGTQSGRKDVEKKSVQRLRKRGIRARLTHTKKYGWEAWGHIKDINTTTRRRRK